jgi:hypothetical protein
MRGFLAKRHLVDLEEVPEGSEELLEKLPEEYRIATIRLLRLKRSRLRAKQILRTKLMAWLKDPNRKPIPFSEQEYRHLGVEYIRKALEPKY